MMSLFGFIVLWCKLMKDRLIRLQSCLNTGERICKKLLGEAIKLAECNGCTKFELEVRQSNAAAINLYSVWDLIKQP